MSTRDIINIYRDFALMAFYNKDDIYLANMGTLEPTDNRLEKFFSELRNYFGARKEPIIAEAEAAYANFKESVSQIQIPADEFNEYLRSNNKGANIREYLNLKDAFKLDLIPILNIDSSHETRGSDRLYEDEDDRPRYSGQTTPILNSRNPFSDITIENQEFIYPDSSGEFQTLEFKVGHTMGRVETEDSAAIVLQPDFKIGKTRDRELRVSTITMDDTITSPMPDVIGDVELLYI